MAFVLFLITSSTPDKPEDLSERGLGDRAPVFTTAAPRAHAPPLSGSPIPPHISRGPEVGVQCQRLVNVTDRLVQAPCMRRATHKRLDQVKTIKLGDKHCDASFVVTSRASPARWMAAQFITIAGSGGNLTSRRPKRATSPPSSGCIMRLALRRCRRERERARLWTRHRSRRSTL